MPFFQYVHLRPSLVELHYRADRVDVAALRDGKLHELVNLVPWEGVALDVKGLRLAGLQVRAGAGSAGRGAPDLKGPRPSGLNVRAARPIIAWVIHGGMGCELGKLQSC